MVLYSEIIKSKAEFHVAWLLGTGDSKKPSRRELLSQNLPNLCTSIIAMVPEKDRPTATKAGLYLLSLLSYGTVLIHREQVDFLQKDVERLKEKVSKKSTIMIFAEKFDLEQNERNQNRGSTPFVSMDDVDQLVDLANLPQISEQLGINGNPHEFTMMDELPNFNQWFDNNFDLTGIYGSVEAYSHNNYTMHSTFVEGNGSDENKEKRGAAVLRDFGDFVVPVKDNWKKRSDMVPDYDIEPVLPRELPFNKQDETLRFSECVLVELQRNQEDPHNPTQWPDLMPNSAHDPHNPTQWQDQPPAQDQHNPTQRADLMPNSAQNPHNPTQWPDQSSAQDPQQLPPGDFDHLAAVPNQLDAIDSLAPIHNGNLIPITTDPFDDSIIPPAKRQKVMDEGDEEVGDRERARKRPSSRPLTPVNPNDLTELHSTIRMESSPPNLDLDSQIRDVLPQRKKSKRNLPFVHGDDLEIDEAVQRAITADFSSLVKKKKDVLVQLPSLRDNALALLETPEPNAFFGRRVPDELRAMFRSCVHAPFTGTNPTDSENEESQSQKDIENESYKFGTVCLCSPNRNPFEEEPLQQRELFDIDYQLPVQQDTLIQQFLNTGDQDALETRILAQEGTFNQDLKFSSVNLLSTPEKNKEYTITEDLNLDPIPIAGNLENFDFSNRQNPTLEITEQIETTRSENLENARHRQKSSLGVRDQRTELLEDISFDNHREERKKKAIRDNIENDNLFFFSSGSLLPDNRLIIHNELLTEAKEVYPEWVDFNKFTADHTAKKAATAFEGLLLGLKNLIVRADQKEPFGTILVQHIDQN